MSGAHRQTVQWLPVFRRRRFFSLTLKMASLLAKSAAFGGCHRFLPASAFRSG